MAQLTHWSYSLFQSLASAVPVTWETPALLSTSLQFSWNSCLHFTISSPPTLPNQLDRAFIPTTYHNYSCCGFQGLSGSFQGMILSPQMTILSLPSQYHLLYVDLKLTSSRLFMDPLLFSFYIHTLVNLLCPHGLICYLYSFSCQIYIPSDLFWFSAAW